MQGSGCDNMHGIVQNAGRMTKVQEHGLQLSAGNERGRGRRGRGRGRRGRGRFEEEDDSHIMTLEEWEARKAGTSTPSHQVQHAAHTCMA